MVVTGFHPIAKLRAQMFTLCWQIVVCNPRITTMKIAILLIAKVKSLYLRADCHQPEPSAGFLIGLTAGAGNPQYI
jgi:hypothetical protein